MESLNSQSSLRSLDAIGRSPGTGRSSILAPGADESGAVAPDFGVKLERALEAAEPEHSIEERGASAEETGSPASALASRTTRENSEARELGEDAGAAVAAPAADESTDVPAPETDTDGSLALPAEAPEELPVAPPSELVPAEAVAPPAQSLEILPTEIEAPDDVTSPAPPTAIAEEALPVASEAAALARPEAGPVRQTRARAREVRPSTSASTAVVNAIRTAFASANPTPVAGETVSSQAAPGAPRVTAGAATSAPADPATFAEAGEGFATFDSEPLGAQEALPASELGPKAAPLVEAAPSAPAPAAADAGALRAPAGSTPLVARTAEVAPAMQAAPAHAAAPYDAAEAASVLKQVRVEITPGLRRASLHLEPARLGRIEIHMTVEAGEMTAVVRAEQPEALAILERHLPELRAMLDQVGIDAGEVDLQLGTGPDDSGQGAERRTGDEGSARWNSTQALKTDQDTHVMDERALARAIASGVGLDTFA